MTELVNQPTGAPTRKVCGSFVVAIGFAFLTKSLPVLFPAILENPAIQPLYMELLTWIPLMVAAAGYSLKEWPQPGKEPQ